MSPDDLSAILAEIRERAAKATPGPWGWRGNIDNGDPYLTSLGHHEAQRADGTVVRHHAGDVLGHIPVEVTRADAILRGVGDPDSLPEPKISREPSDTYDERYSAAIEAARESEIESYLLDDYGNPRTEQRLAFCTDWIYTDARKLVTFEVASGALSRADSRVYRADIAGIRHPDAEFIAAARSDVPRLLAALEAALRFHEPVQLHELAFDLRGNPRCAHDPGSDPDAHYEGDDGEWRCESLPAGTACSGCPESPDGEYADWPCDEYEAILAELTGKGRDGD